MKSNAPWDSPLLRACDLMLAGGALLVGWPLLVVLLGLGWLDTGAPLFRQVRVGRQGRPFVLYKLRTMRLETPSVATHLADPNALTRFGRFLRRTKLDELPQLWNVIRGEMSLVGPRPCLPNQKELIEARDRLGVLAARPGITGLAQIRGIDMSQPQRLARVDAEMLRDFSLRAYFRYLWLTLRGQGRGDRIRGDGLT
ncbi:O-antigen biosynthesis protein WbqP [Methylomarinovum caldicuralii]|uniref:O-antigen biosynthesis protein WbqP n=1 Tax=Methylomarinovum caldicuralii TaxID=438856 RepID=A0AAU9CAF5_9GAMM|nr:sugar transferase [Methylomarinovum caldicuralii]BCX81484.1 O-antigen biosynthesis protein WbqP [Methylomarinovum caldicuralii]